MLKEPTFNIVWVAEDHGAGIPSTEKPDVVVHYNGKPVRDKGSVMLIVKPMNSMMSSLKIGKIAAGVAAVFPAAVGILCHAENPIVQTSFTADPAPMVYNDTVYLYTSHDEDDAFGFKMFNWKCYTTSDMVNWTDHGTIASLSTFSYCKEWRWAPQCIFRNGKFYLYAPVAKKAGGMAIGVAVSTNAFGPFADPLGKPLIANSRGDIDPTEFIDDDGQAYLYWGNPDL